MLNVRRPPARLTVQQTAEVLGFVPHEISILMSERVGMLKPLGTPAPNAQKYFFATEILDLAQNKAWLHRATKAVSAHWRERNSLNGEASHTA